MTLNNHVFGASRLYANGNLCINNNADFLGEALIVKGNLFVGNGLGRRLTSESRDPRGDPRRRGGRLPLPQRLVAQPCTDADHVYGKKDPPNWVAGGNQIPPTIAAPTVDLPGWYEHAVPGPAQGCGVSTATTPVFDNDYPNRMSTGT
jgi:hypothetical protein